MNSFFTGIRQTLIPDLDGKHGPLPPLLVAMTVVTGLVDAFSYLVLGHVFVANMTGNVVFLGFAVAGAQGFSTAASAAAIASFGVGALVGGKIGSRLGQHRGRLLASSATIQAALLAISAVLASLPGSPIALGYRYPLIVCLSTAMGIQNASARRLGVPDLTTTVLTLTITGIAADSVIVGGKGSQAGRRSIAVAAMLVGALVGAAFVVRGHTVYPLVLALIVLIVVAATARALGRPTANWIGGGTD
jgi:uncharacterized membrane protein YoaK (UPF0700 family)